MRKLFLLLVPFLLVGLASATQMYIGDTTTVNGQTLKVLTIYEDCSALIQVGDVSPRVVANISKQVGPLLVKVSDCFYAGDSSFAYVEASYNTVVATCNTDSECNDNNFCTIDFCTGNPKRCDYASSHFPVTNCLSGDKCCPTNCTWKTDNDCPGVECEENKECADDLCWTNNTCVNGKCQSVVIAGCDVGDYCCPPGCFYTTSLDIHRDNDCSKLSECLNDSQCDDKNNATIDSCFLPAISTDPKICTHKTNESYILTNNTTNNTTSASNQSIPVAEGNISGSALINSQDTVILERLRANKKILLLMMAASVIFVIIILIVKKRNS